MACKSPKEMSAQEWRDWVDLCVSNGLISKQLLGGTKMNRDAEYEKAWKLAEAASGGRGR